MRPPQIPTDGFIKAATTGSRLSTKNRRKDRGPAKSKLPAIPDPDPLALGACKTAPVEWFASPRRIVGADLEPIRRGLLTCDNCPVIQECGDERARMEQEIRIGVPGVWGGQLWYGTSKLFSGQRSFAGARVIPREQVFARQPKS